MKSRMMITLVLAAVCLAIGLPAFAQGNADPETRKEVMAVLEKAADSYQKRDMNTFLGLMSGSNDMMVYLPGKDQKELGKAALREQTERDWKEMESSHWTYEWTSISTMGNVAWTASDITFHAIQGGHAINAPSRMTTVLTREGKNKPWIVQQVHVSSPMMPPPEGTPVPEGHMPK